ncbi:MAG: hypothetical protein WD825_12990 [Gemmatimonadaceae bacterium]
MKRSSFVGRTVLAVAVVVAGVAACSEADKKTWTTNDVWYHESDVASLVPRGRPQFVEFFHPD